MEDIAIDSAASNNGQCKCVMAPGLKRLHLVKNGSGSWPDRVDEFCQSCGHVPSLSASLHSEDLTASMDLYRLIGNGHAAVKSGNVTTAIDENMPDPLHFHELGLIKCISSSALFKVYPKDRPTLEPILRDYLGLSNTQKTRALQAENFTDIEASIDYTVGHIFEPDPDTGRPDRIDDNHMLPWPLIPMTLREPYEIWKQQPEGHSNEKGWAFFGCYLLDGYVIYHEVWVNRRRFVRSSYQLNGRPQALGKRRGIPIYTAY